jgi:hypothetical protein
MYHWLTPQPIADQLANFANLVKTLAPGEFVQLDIEERYPGGAPTLNETQIRTAMTAFLRQYPGRVCHYGDAGYLHGIHASIEGPWWIAAYRSTLGPVPSNVAVWQWGGIDVPGYPHPIDANQIISRDLLDKLTIQLPHKENTVYTPAIRTRPIVSTCKGPDGQGILALGDDGSVYLFETNIQVPSGALIGANGLIDFQGRIAKEIYLGPAPGQWTIEATSGEKYVFPYTPVV